MLISGFIARMFNSFVNYTTMKKVIEKIENDKINLENKIKYLKEEIANIKENEEQKKIKIQNNNAEQIDILKKKIKYVDDDSLKQKQNQINILEKTIKDLEKKLEIGKNKENQELHQILNSRSKYIEQLQKNYKMTVDKNKAQIEELKKMFSDLIAKEKEAQKENQEKQKRKEEEFNREIENLRKQRENEKNEQKKKEALEKERMEILYHSYEKGLSSIKSNKINFILEDFKQNKNKNFCTGDISKLTKVIIEILIKKLFEIEKINLSIKFHLSINMQEIQKNIQNVEHLNILLLGMTGAGKTTLINSILNLNLETGFGKPITKKIESFSSKEIPFIRLVDSRGIEKDSKYGVDFIYNQISTYIKKQIREKEPDEYIHCIWYCWYGQRLEQIELDILEKLSKHYSLKDLPVIIVYTQTVSQEDVKNAKKYLENNNIKNEFIDVLAFEKETGRGESTQIQTAYNLDKLLELSIRLAKEAVNSSCYEGLLEKNKKLIAEKLNKLVKILKEKLNAKIENIILEIGSNIYSDNLEKKITEIIVELFSYFFFLNPDIKVDPQNNYRASLRRRMRFLQFKISDVTLEIIQSNARDYLKEFLNIYQKNLDILVEKYKEELINEINNYKMNFMMNNLSKDQKLFKIESTEESEKNLKNYIKYNLNFLNITKKVAFQNFFRNITSPLIDKFSVEFSKLYNIIMSSKDSEEEAKSMIKVSFDKIEESIKKYNEAKTKNNNENIELQQDNKEKEIKSDIFSNEEYNAMIDDLNIFKEIRKEK